MNEDLPGKALEVARAVVARRLARDRFELEPEREGEQRWSHVFERPHYRASFRLFESAGVAAVRLVEGSSSPRVRFPATSDDREEGAASGEEPTELEAHAARRAAEEAARRAGRAGALRTSVESAGAAVVSGRRVVLARVRVLAAAEDGAVSVELDASTGERLAYFVPAFLRGSRSGRALSQQQVLLRSSDDEAPPDGAVLARASLEDEDGVRAWRLRFDVDDGEREGHVVVVAHARTGAVAGLTTTVRARPRLGLRRERALAEAAVARALPELLGTGASLAALVPGALMRRRRVHAGWIGTATTRSGRVVRVSLFEDEVEAFVVGGRTLRSRVPSPAGAPA